MSTPRFWTVSTVLSCPSYGVTPTSCICHLASEAGDVHHSPRADLGAACDDRIGCETRPISRYGPAILILVFLSVAGLCQLFGGTMCLVRAGQAHGGIGGGFAKARVSSRSSH